MARQNNTQLVGSIGNLIFYKFRGGYYMRAKPVDVKRTEGSIRSGKNFGKASQLGRQIREMIKTINPSKSDKRMIYRFTGALNKMISWKEKYVCSSRPGNLPFINGFQFNPEADIPLAIDPNVHFPGSGLMEVRLTPFVSAEGLYAPSNTDHIVIKIIVTSTNMSEMKTAGTDIAEIKIPYNHEIFFPEIISLPVYTNRETLVLIVLTIEYFVNKKEGIEILNSPKKMPCGIIWSDWL